MISRIRSIAARASLMIIASACTEPATGTVPTTGPASMIAISDMTQTATVATLVASSPTVRVLDPLGKPVAGAVVLFTGANFGAREVTSTDGIASTSWRLDPSAGSQWLDATLRDAHVPAIKFVATAVADTAALIDAAAMSPQAGLASAPVEQRPSVVVTDAFHNGVAGVEVTFEVTTGGGSVLPAKTVTDATGLATVERWTLGSDPGENRLVARTSHLAPVTFTALVNLPFAASSIVSGTQHTCAIVATGETYCWGANDRGQVNSSTSSALTIPARVSTDRRFVALAAGASSTCAISNEVPSQAYCWGVGYVGGTTGTGAPSLIAVEDGLTMVSSGDTHGCGLTPSGAAYCWGDGTWGQLGNAGTGQGGPQPVATPARFVALAAGAQHTCGLASDGQLYCWGLGDHGQLGFSPGANCFIYDYYGNTPVLCALTPQRVANAPKFVAIAAGYGTCGLTADHEVFCFGFPGGSVLVSSGIPFTRLTPDGNCGETDDDRAYCWSRSSDSLYAALLNAPLEVGTGLRFSTLSSSRGHQCGIERSTGSVVCWGRNDKGQLGNRTTAPSTTPLPAARPETP